MQQTVYFRDTSGIVHARARVSWDNGPTVTVNVEYNESNSWRIKPAGSNTTPVLTVTNGSTYGSFTALDGQTYVFQSVASNGNWDNSRDGSGEFTVDFGGSSGGNTGGGTTGGGTTGGGTTGGGTTTGGVHYLCVKQADNVNISVCGMEPTSRPGVFAQYDLTDWWEYEVNGSVWLIHNIAEEDCFSVSVEAAEGYELISNDILGLYYDEEDGVWKVDPDSVRIYITAAAVLKVDGTYVLGNSAKSAKFRAYQFDGNNWLKLDALGVPPSANMKKQSGTVYVDTYDFISVECGFAPDLVVFSFGATLTDGDTVCKYSAAAAFHADDTDAVITGIHLNMYSQDTEIYVQKTANGFNFSTYYILDGYWSEINNEIQYTAIKYT